MTKRADAHIHLFSGGYKSGMNITLGAIRSASQEGRAGAEQIVAMSK